MRKVIKFKCDEKIEKKEKEIKMENRKAWEAIDKLYTILEKNNLLNAEIRSYIWDLEDYINMCELSIYERYDLAKSTLKRLKKGERK